MSDGGAFTHGFGPASSSSSGDSIARDQVREVRVAENVSLPEAARLGQEHIQPLESRVDHPLRTAPKRASAVVEGSPDADHHRDAEAAGDHRHPFLLQRRTQTDPQNVWTCLLELGLQFLDLPVVPD